MKLEYKVTGFDEVKVLFDDGTPVEIENKEKKLAVIVEVEATLVNEDGKPAASGALVNVVNAAGSRATIFLVPHKLSFMFPLDILKLAGDKVITLDIPEQS